MNKIQDLLCTVEQGQELAKLGVTAKSQWVQFMNGKYGIRVPTGYYAPDIGVILSKEKIHGVINLYGLGELMRMADASSRICQRWLSESNILWGWLDYNLSESINTFQTMEQAAADMVIWQLKSKFITPSQCNAALVG